MPLTVNLGENKPIRHSSAVGINLLGLNRFAVVTRGKSRCHHLIFLQS